MAKYRFLKILVGILAMQGSLVCNAADSDHSTAPGLSVKEAIEVCRAQGQRQYLSKLICPDASHPTFKRVGSFGTRDPYPGNLTQAEADKIILRLMGDPTLEPGDPHFHMVDGYEVDCPSGSTMIYMDFYHCDQELPSVVPPGFTIQR